MQEQNNIVNSLTQLINRNSLSLASISEMVILI